MSPTTEMMRGCAALLWDFDGVIKESVAVKSDAFEQLFAPFGPEIAARVRRHHECNGGMSRYDKLPLYLEWAGQAAAPADIAHYDTLFSAAVEQAVIDSAWVPGAMEYLAATHGSQPSTLITATPQAEIERILGALRVYSLFRSVQGAPTPKIEAIRRVIAGLDVRPDAALMIGDAESDLQAAVANGVPFLLRRTPLNRELQERYRGPQCEDFVDG
jgi:phosphoglycolate phosphatase-like HAD superfamily hydrolase